MAYSRENLTSATGASLDLEVGVAHDLAPLLHLALDAGTEVLGRVEHRVKADLLQPLLDFGQRADSDHLLVELVDDLRWRAGRHHEAGERIGLLPGRTGFRD